VIELSEMQDCVYFMSAYMVKRRKKKLPVFKRKKKLADLFAKTRVSHYVIDGTVGTPKGAFKYSTTFDSYKQSTNFEFDKSLNDVQDEVKQLSWILALTHSMEKLLDKDLFNFAFFANMESFLVSVNSRVLQVDPFVFCLNEVIFVNFELIDYCTTKPLNKDDILGRINNYNIIPVEKVRYFDEEEFSPDTRKISDIIFDNLNNLLNNLTEHKLITDSVAAPVYNIFVRSNDIGRRIDEYFLAVLDAEDVNLELKNLSGTNAFKYFSQEFLGVATRIAVGSEEQVLFECQLLEAVKMYFFVNQYAALTFTNDLNKLVDSKMRIESLVFVRGTPAITLFSIENMKQTFTYKKNEKALDFKISFLKLSQEHIRNKNAKVLNFLLYLLAFIGGIGALEVLHEQFCWNFGTIFSMFVFIFLGLPGGYWVWQKWRSR